MFTLIVSGSLLAECKRTNILQKRISMYKLIISASALVKQYFSISTLIFYVYQFFDIMFSDLVQGYEDTDVQ